MGENDAPLSLHSLQHIRTSELYPKKVPIVEDKELVVPFTLLCGEYLVYLGHSANGNLGLSNYRLYHQFTKPHNTFYNIPLGLIELIEVKDILFLHICCKDARTYRLTFSTNELCLEWMRRLVKATSPVKNVEEVFAFALYAWAMDEGTDEMLSQLTKDPLNSANDKFKHEVERLEFDVSESGVWRVSKANSDFRLCSSYPRYLLVPACITDLVLDAAAKFRSARRVPAVVWRHRGNGAVIARCSQPEVGWLGWRSPEDEELLKAIAEACHLSSPQPSDNVKKLLIMDARSYTTAVANRARGGGCECEEYYPNCDIQFMNLANIHAIRKSFSTLRSICSPADDQPNWYSLLEGTRWLHNMSGLLHAAVTVTSAVENEGRPVLVHCSDGWDRTPEIVSLAQILLDPYYRTVQGFRVLVEREWLEFGHKFADRCGHTDDANERCPVFLQWLDCVHNLVKQYPCAFQLNSNYLVKLAQHTYSNMFGTFLCNNSRERREVNVAGHTFSVWSLLQAPQYINHLYSAQEQVLWPSCNVRDLVLWRELYLGASLIQDSLPLSQPTLALTHQDSNANVESEFMNGEDLNGNGEEQNNHLEEFDFQPKNEDFKDNNGDGPQPVAEPVSGYSVESWTCSTHSFSHTVTEASANGLKPDEVDSLLTETVNSSTSVKIPYPENEDLENVAKEVSAWKIQSSSAQSSTETLIPTNGSSQISERCEESVNGFSRTFPPMLDPVDGLTPLKDDIQQRLAQIVLEHKAKEVALERLERELHTTRLALLQQVCHQCTTTTTTTPNPADRPDDDGSVCSTEVSWEAVEEHETLPTLWMPDHAVSHCQGCHNQFWLGRRKHHCRSCGKIFCADCSENAVALPEEQLYQPVRVCTKCFNNPAQTTSCKQATQLGELVQSAHSQA